MHLKVLLSVFFSIELKARTTLSRQTFLTVFGLAAGSTGPSHDWSQNILRLLQHGLTNHPDMGFQTLKPPWSFTDIEHDSFALSPWSILMTYLLIWITMSYLLYIHTGNLPIDPHWTHLLIDEVNFYCFAQISDVSQMLLLTSLGWTRIRTWASCSYICCY
jgi:hypothetical protein